MLGNGIQKAIIEVYDGTIPLRLVHAIVMPLRRSKRESRNHAIQRYEKQRRKNLLAQPGIHDFVIVLDNLKAGFNVPKIFRSAEAFGAREVHLVNIGMFDPAPGKGSFKKVPARFFDTFEESYLQLRNQGYTVFTLAAGDGEILTTCQLPKKSAFVFGHEERGHSFNNADYPDIVTLSIPQFGMVESLNVSVAASIVMYEYTRQHGDASAQHNPIERPAGSKIRRKKNRIGQVSSD